MSPTGRPDTEPEAPSAVLAHEVDTGDSPTSSTNSGSMLDWPTSASSDMYFTSPPEIRSQRSDVIQMPPSTSNDAIPTTAAPPNAVPTNSAPNATHPDASGPHPMPFTPSWDDFSFPTDWISPSPSVCGETKTSRPNSIAQTGYSHPQLADTILRAPVPERRLSVELLSRSAENVEMVCSLDSILERASSARSRREVTTVGSPSRRPSPVPTILDEDDDALSPSSPSRSSQFGLNTWRKASDTDYSYRKLTTNDSMIMTDTSPRKGNEIPESSKSLEQGALDYSPSAHSCLDHSSQQASPSLGQMSDDFNRMRITTNNIAASGTSYLNSMSPPSPLTTLPSTTHPLPFSPTKSIPVGSLLGLSSSNESTESRAPKPQPNSADLMSLLQSCSSLGGSTTLEPDPARGRQRFRREFPQSALSPVIRPSGLQSSLQTESEPSLGGPATASTLSSEPSSSYVSAQPWTGLSVTQPLAESKPRTVYGRIVHPLPPTPPLPSQAGNMYTLPSILSQPLQASLASGSVTTDTSRLSTDNTQYQQRHESPIPISLYAHSMPPPLPPPSYPSLPSIMPPLFMPTGFEPWRSNDAYMAVHTSGSNYYNGTYAGPWPRPAHTTSVTSVLANNTGQEPSFNPFSMYSSYRPVWSPLPYNTYPATAPLPTLVPQPIPPPPSFLTSREVYGQPPEEMSPHVSVTTPFIPALDTMDSNAASSNSWSAWGQPPPSGVRFTSPLPSPPSDSPPTPRLYEQAGPSTPNLGHTSRGREHLEHHHAQDPSGVRFSPTERYAGGWTASPYAPVIPALPLQPVPPVPSLRPSFTSSKRYSFTDASVAFKVEDAVFKVHRSFFERHSSYFRRALAGYTYLGSWQPFHLPCVKKCDFENLLSIFYPNNFSKPDIEALQDWVGVLSLSQKWEMHQIKHLCVRHIGHLAWPMEKVIIAHKYDLHNPGPSWLFAAYKDVCTRSVPLALRDAEQLSMEIVVNIWQIHHEVSTMRLRGESVEATEKHVDELVKEKFGPFDEDDTPARQAGRMASFYSW